MRGGLIIFNVCFILICKQAIICILKFFSKNGTDND